MPKAYYCLASLLLLLLPKLFSAPYVRASEDVRRIQILHLQPRYGSQKFLKAGCYHDVDTVITHIRGGGSGCWGGPWAQDDLASVERCEVRFSDTITANATDHDQGSRALSSDFQYEKTNTSSSCVPGPDGNATQCQEMTPRALAAAALEARLQRAALMTRTHDKGTLRRSLQTDSQESRSDHQDIVVRVRRLHKFKDKLPSALKKTAAQKRGRITKGVPKKLWQQV
jgi:hypothetical protein